MSEPRKASDVVLELETKIDTLLKIVSLQSQSINLISNKLNTVMATLDKEKSKITVEAINKSPTPTFNGFVPDPERAIPIFAESRIPIESAPQGFRRTSRPETFEQPQVNSYQNKSEEIEFKDHPSAMVPAKAFPNQKAPEKSPLPQVQKKTIPTAQKN